MTPATAVGRAGGASSSSGPSGDSAARSDLYLVIILGILWGSAFPVIRAGIVAGAPPLLFAAIRYVFTAIALVPIALATRTPRPSLRGIVPPLAFGGLLMIGTYGGLLYLGETSTSGGLAAVLTASVPLVSALVGFRLLPTERLGRWGVGGLLVGFAGVAVLVLPQIGSSKSAGLDGPLLVMGAVVAFAVGSVLLRKTARIAPSFWTLSVQFAVAAGLVGSMALLDGEPLVLGNGSVVLPSLAYLVILAGIAGYTLYFRIHHTSGPTWANLVGYVNPATGVLVGLIVFGETVTGIEIGGLFLIAGGLFLLQRDRRRSAPQPLATPPVRPQPLAGGERSAPAYGSPSNPLGEIPEGSESGSPGPGSEP